MLKNPFTTLCYLEKDGKYLMLHRIYKKNDENAGKWIGVGGHFEEGESPEECLKREVLEETGLTLTSWRFRGLITFSQDGYGTEYMHLFTSDSFTGELKPCTEGELSWVPKEKILSLELWEGDPAFLELLLRDEPFFTLKLVYEGNRLVEKELHTYGRTP